MPSKLKFHDPQATFDPLKALTPYSVPWNSVAVHICNTEVPVSQLMYALNASVVGLCRADTRQVSQGPRHLVFKVRIYCSFNT